MTPTRPRNLLLACCLATAAAIASPTTGHAFGFGDHWGHDDDCDHGTTTTSTTVKKTTTTSTSTTCSSSSTSSTSTSSTSTTSSTTSTTLEPECTTAGDCSDGSGCTTDTCEDGVCAHTSVPGCVSCASATDCGDGDACTADSCNAEGVCGHSERTGCVACTTVSDCDDHNACTADVCQADGSCAHVAIPGCKPCGNVTACNDGDSCTTEACVAGRCEYTQAVECACTATTEVCGDGEDNDCDGSVDCADANCSAAPGCAGEAEVCGDCIDNDHDGLVDYEDGDCCADEMQLGLRRLTLKTKTARTRGNGMRIKARNLSASRAAFDPTHQDTTLQISDESGQLFCQTVSAKNWKKKGKRSYRFRDKKGTFAGGLKKGRFKIKKNGQIVFRTKGKKMSLRTPSKSKVDVTLRVGGACWAAPATLRKKKNPTTLTTP